MSSADRLTTACRATWRWLRAAGLSTGCSPGDQYRAPPVWAPGARVQGYEAEMIWGSASCGRQSDRGRRQLREPPLRRCRVSSRSPTTQLLHASRFDYLLVGDSGRVDNGTPRSVTSRSTSSLAPPSRTVFRHLSATIDPDERDVYDLGVDLNNVRVQRANPVTRASEFIHEGWHAWQWDNGHNPDLVFTCSLPGRRPSRLVGLYKWQRVRPLLSTRPRRRRWDEKHATVRCIRRRSSSCVIWPTIRQRFSSSSCAPRRRAMPTCSA